MSAIERQAEPVLRCEVRPQRESVVLALLGELDLETVGIVEEELEELKARGFESLVLDLTDLAFIDSTGLRLLMTWTRAARRGGPRFGICERPSLQVRRALDLAGLTEHMTFVRL